MLACLTQAGATAHGPAGESFVQNPAHLSGAPPAYCGLCREVGDCSIKAAMRPRALRNIGRYEAPQEILAFIDAASAMTKIDFDYLLRTAALESSFDPSLAAATSTAAGLYQFVEQSWFHMMQQSGAELGFEHLVGAIGTDENGFYEIAVDEAREEILRLRYDPELSAIFAGLFTQRNFETLARMIEREPGAGELYVAHVLGASGAAELIRLVAEDPDAKAEKHFRRAARANRAIFFHKDNKPRSAAEVYEYLTGKYLQIPVDVAEDPVSGSTPLPWQPLLPGWRLGGDDVPYAMLWLRAGTSG
jgi:hypothetical protein